MQMKDRLLTAAKSLKVRLALFLSLAILPLGMIAVQQTAAVVQDAQRLEQQDILARTAQAAGTQSALLRQAQGAATALGASALEVGNDTELCTRIMERFVDRAPAYAFAGFITPDGMINCFSTGTPVDLSDRPDWLEFAENPRPTIAVNESGPASGLSVIVVTVPIFRGDSTELLGAASVSLPHSMTDTLLAAQVDDVDLALMDDQGRILSASTGIENTGAFEALSVSPEELGLTQSGLTFTVVREDGTEQLAALVPLIEDRVFVLGLWSGAVQNYSVSILGTFTPLFPVLMWIVAFGVGFLALDRLILRHLRQIRTHMAAFSFDDPGSGFATLTDPPVEFSDIAETYNRMIDRIMGNHAELADNLEEKEVLLREVHHRVKNNLQLIASILNMQIRSVPDGDAKRVLRRVQDRVMSLSTIHKALYTGTTMTSVRADRLLGEVVQGAFAMGIPQGKGVETIIDMDPVELDPDQAVPLALLANETVTNAIKYLGQSDDAPPYIAVKLTSDGRHITLDIANSLGTPVQDEIAIDGTGLGARLVEAFVAQLGGTSEISHEDDRFAFRITFTAFDLDDEDDDDDFADDSDATAASPAQT